MKEEEGKGKAKINTKAKEAKDSKKEVKSKGTKNSFPSLDISIIEDKKE